jgi:hypothetical protein
MATRKQQIAAVPERLTRFVPSEWPAEHACYRDQTFGNRVYRHGEDCGFFPRFCQYHEARLAHEGLNTLDVLKEDNESEWQQVGQVGVEELYVDGEPYVQVDDVTWMPAEGEGEPVLMGNQTPRILVTPS